MEHEAETVDAIAQAGRLRTVIEDVAEMAAATAAMHLGAQHAVGTVLGLADIALDRLIKARPAGAALEFGVGGKQRQVAAGAGAHALAMVLHQCGRSRSLGALIAQDLVLLRRELGAPFGLGLFDLEFFGGLRRSGAQPAERGQAEQAGDGSEQETAVGHYDLRVKRTEMARSQIRGVSIDV